MNKWTDKMNRWVDDDEWASGWMDKWMKKQTKWRNKQMDRHMDGQMHVKMKNKQMNDWMNCCSHIGRSFTKFSGMLPLEGQENKEI